MAYSLCLIPVHDKEIAGLTKSPAPGQALKHPPCCSSPRMFFFTGISYFLVSFHSFYCLFLLVTCADFKAKFWYSGLFVLDLSPEIFLFIYLFIFPWESLSSICLVLHASYLFLSCAGRKILLVTALCLHHLSGSYNFIIIRNCFYLAALGAFQLLAMRCAWAVCCLAASWKPEICF